jgi:hypothetical protein
MRHDNRHSQPVRQPHVASSDESFAFRRSRTITGSAATNVRAAADDRGQLRSPRLHEHSLRKHRRKLGLYFLLSCSIIGVLAYAVMSYISTVSVTLQSAQTVQKPLDDSKYQGLVQRYFEEHPFEHFSFSLKEEAFNDYMVRSAPEIATATMTADGPWWQGSLGLRLREPVVAWTIRDQQYFVDSQGVAYTTNYFATPAVSVTDKSGVSASAGVVASTKLLRFIGRVITLVDASGISPVQSVELPTNSTRQVDFKLADHAYVIKAHMDRDPAGQAADIVSAVRYVQQKQINPEYLDVRVASKAFYREQ